MTAPVGEHEPVLAERDRAPAGRGELLLVALVLLLAAGLRVLDLGEPWSGRPNDFRSAFGGAALGGPARNFYTHGFLETKLVPVEWRVELEDGTREYSWYPHHPTTATALTALSMLVFGPTEAAARLPWVFASLLAVLATWRLARLVWNGRVALLSAAFMATVPLAAHFASMPWIDGLVVALFCELSVRYVLWLRTGARRQLWIAAGLAFVGGLCEWSSAFLFPGLGLHALVVLGGRRRWRALLATLLLPAGLFAGFAVHAVHFRLALPADALEHDTRTTLAWVTSLPIPLVDFLALQWSQVSRYLTPPVLATLVCALAGLLLRAVRRRSGPVLTAEEGVLVPLALAGVLYVAAFPSRSFNHYFFIGLSMPGFAAACALVLLSLWRRASRARSLGALAVPTLPLVAVGLFAAVEAFGRGADATLRPSEPATFLALPLVFARYAPFALLGALLVALGRRRVAMVADLALGCALVGLLSFAAWDDVRFWSTRGSDRIGRLVEEPWMQELLEDEQAAIVAAGNVSMPLQFYSSAPVFIGVHSVERLRALRERILGRLGEGRPVVFVYETERFLADARSGVLKPEAAAELLALRTFLEEVAEPERRGEYEVFDLSAWSRER